jgi:hypothetical protein
MILESQQIAIAEACGWRDIKHTNHEDVDIESRSIIYWSGLTGVPPEFIHYENRTRIPDYLKDLNAMHDAEKVLTYAQGGDMTLWIQRMTCAGYGPQLFATAPQRAEAFLRTIGKWEDGK